MTTERAYEALLAVMGVFVFMQTASAINGYRAERKKPNKLRPNTNADLVDQAEKHNEQIIQELNDKISRREEADQRRAATAIADQLRQRQESIRPPR